MAVPRLIALAQDPTVSAASRFVATCATLSLVEPYRELFLSAPRRHDRGKRYRSSSRDGKLALPKVSSREEGRLDLTPNATSTGAAVKTH